MTTKSETLKFMHRTGTPRAAAVAGILFGVLFGWCIVLLYLALPPVFADMDAWTDEGRRLASLAFGLMPLAGLAFLWFVGVVRDRLGVYEDQFFAAVFQGSGLLFLAMTFCTFAIGAGMLTAYRIGGDEIMTNSIFVVGRSIISQMFNIYALRMAAVFMFSLSTLWLRTAVMPRAVCFFSYAMAIAMFVGPNLSLLMVLIFPAWVLCISVYILVLSFRRKPSGSMDGMTAQREAN
jgi:hypothetical protein